MCFREQVYIIFYNTVILDQTRFLFARNEEHDAVTLLSIGKRCTQRATKPSVLYPMVNK